MNIHQKILQKNPDIANSDSAKKSIYALIEESAHPETETLTSEFNSNPMAQINHIIQKPNEQELIKECQKYNSSSNIIQFTTNCFPKTKNLSKELKVPLFALIQPFATNLLKGNEEENSVIFNNTIVRCKNCKAYINPFVKFANNGQVWECNLCSKQNFVPQAYLCAPDSNEQRIDKLNKVELNQGTYDILLEPNGSEKRIGGTYFFLIDVSCEAIKSGIVDDFTLVLKEAIKNNYITGNIGLITYDEAVHVYNISPKLKLPQIIVINETKELFFPLKNKKQFIWKMDEQKEAILSLLVISFNLYIYRIIYLNFDKKINPLDRALSQLFPTHILQCRIMEANYLQSKLAVVFSMKFQFNLS